MRVFPNLSDELGSHLIRHKTKQFFFSFFKM